MFFLPVHLIQRRQEIVPLLPDPRIERRPRRQHTRHLAAHNLFRKPGVLHLIAECNPVTLAQQARQVLLHSVVRHAAHGHVALSVARRQCQLQFPAGHGSIVVKQFVKIAHPEEQQRIGILPLGRRPLAHEWRQLALILFSLGLISTDGGKRKSFAGFISGVISIEQPSRRRPRRARSLIPESNARSGRKRRLRLAVLGFV